MLQKAIDYLKKNNINAYRICELKNGKVVSYEFQPANPINSCYSLSKSFTATAVGILENRNQLALNDKLIDFFPEEFKNKSNSLSENLTIHNLLTHTCGFENGFLFEGDKYLHETDNWISLLFSEPTPYEAGSKSVYSNATYFMLSCIVEKITHKTLFEFLRQELLLPLKFKDFAACACPLGHTIGATGMIFSCEDLLKLGKLYLDDGVYENKRYLSSNFISKATAPLYPCMDRFYGYSFWKNQAQDHFFYGDGAHGQLIFVHRPSDTVLTLQSYDNQLIMKNFTNYLADEL